jgi:hypothetical protein
MRDEKESALIVHLRALADDLHREFVQVTSDGNAGRITVHEMLSQRHEILREEVAVRTALGKLIASRHSASQ